MNQAVRNKRQKKQYKPPFHQSETQGEEGKKKGRHKRQFRDKKRTLEPPSPAPCSDSGSGSGPHSNSISPSPSPSEVSIELPTAALTTVEETLVSDLEDLHVSLAEMDEDTLGVGTFMAPPTPAPTPASTQAIESNADTQLESEAFVLVGNDTTTKEEEGKSGENEGGDDDDDDVFPTPFIPNAGCLDEQGVLSSKGIQGEDDGKRIIVEALVVRKMSLEEAFLDFGTFA